MADLDAASPDDVRQFFRDWYAPNNCVVSIVGDVDEEEAFVAAERWFGPIPANPAIAPFAAPSLPARIGREVRETVPDAVPLVRIHFGFRTPPFGAAAFDALEVAAQILAGGKGSRLHRTLVRERPSPRTWHSSRAARVRWLHLRRLGDRPARRTAEVEAGFLAELDRVAAEPVSDDELAAPR
jgi:hypothetical protein